jgi:hypothetical protein
MLERSYRRSCQRLIQGGVSPRLARRILREFAEHHADLVSEYRSLGLGAAAARAAAASRLGSTEQLVAGTLARPELRSWLRRRPCAAFTIAPLLAFAAAFVVSLVGLVAFFQWRKARGDSLSVAVPLMHWLTEGASVCLLWALPVTVAAAIALLAVRHREESVWPLIGMMVTCGVGALTNLSFDFPPLATQPGMTAGIGLGADNLSMALTRAVSAAILTALPYQWARRARRRDDALT